MTVDETRRKFLRRVGATGVLSVGGVSGCLGQLTANGQPIRFGAILPVSLSGLLGTVASHGTKAAEQAVEDVNRAGGPLGREIEFTTNDSAADTETAVEAYRSLRDDGTIGFVGGLLSDVSLRLVEEVPGECMQVSSSSTHPSLATKGFGTGDAKFFARTVPSDIQQAVVMAKVLNGDRFIGADTAAIVHVDDSFGSGLAEKVSAQFDGSITATVPYSTDAESHDAVLEAAFADDPDGVALVSTPGNAQSLLEQAAANDYESEWVLSAGLLPDSPSEAYQDIYSASVAVQETNGALQLHRELRDITPLAPFAANAYDALFLQALAVERAGEATPQAIAENIRAVSSGQGHTVTVGEFDRAKTLLEAGREVNYQGAAGGVDLNENLEPLNSYLIEQVRDGRVEQLKLLRSSFFEGRVQ